MSVYEKIFYRVDRKKQDTLSSKPRRLRKSTTVGGGCSMNESWRRKAEHNSKRQAEREEAARKAIRCQPHPA